MTRTTKKTIVADLPTGGTDKGQAARLPFPFAGLGFPRHPSPLANPAPRAYIHPREVGAGERLANPVRTGR